MLYVFYGNNIARGRAKLNEFLQKFESKHEGVERFRVTEENYSKALLEELAGGQGLFLKKYIVILDQVFESDEGKASFLENIQMAAESPNLFVLFEAKLDAASKKKIEKFAEKIVDVSEKKDAAKKSEPFNRFALADAVGKRDRKSAWMLYVKARRSGALPEELHGLVFWQIKAMLIAMKETAESSGLNPFVYRKARGFLAHYKEGELEGVSGKLVTLYHEARRGKGELDTALERFLLEL